MKVVTNQKRIEWTPEDRARHKAIREQFKHRPSLEELLASGEFRLIAHRDYMTIRLAVTTLKKERDRQGLTLADVAKRTGLRKAALARLETGQMISPTLETLSRYARALGKELVCSLQDPDAAESATPPEAGKPERRRKKA